MWWFIVIFVTCLFYYSWQRLRYFSSRGVRTLPPFPFLGNLTAVTFGRENFVDAIAAGYNAFKDQRYFGLYQYHVPTLIPRDPELVRRLVVRDFAAFCDRGVHIPPDCDPLFGRNLIMLRGSKWRSMRASLSPAFSAARSRSMAPLMAECAAATMDYLRIHVETGKEIDTDKIVTAYVNDVIASCAFGFAVDSLQDPTNCIFRLGQTAVVQHTTQVMKFFGYENFPRVMKLLGVKIISTSDADKFAQLFKSALKSRREQQSQPRPDFIQTLVDAAQGKLKDKQEDPNNNEDSTNWTKKFSDDDLVAQAVLFYVAGFDTTANLINYFLYEMAVNPEVQRRLLAEIDEADKSGDLYEAVQGLQYLDMCVNEVLRLWPLVGSADRRSVAPYNFGPTAPGSKHELTAEAGIHVWLPIYSIHRDEAYWPNPDQCDPERFSPERKSEIVPYTYMPFGNGPRHCIGSRFAVLAAKVFLVRILSGFRVRPGDKTPRSQRLHPIAFILRPADGFHLVVEPRDSLYSS
ncbi:cytochrome P450 9e2 isoform X4 [Plutella xylostella]|uniref:cytochrome P450 9e2 isoform X4 n=1 Tax=Plutella xylostella TaxID=51655 RepID=UPI0020327B13|nr:cytochrome P450 9e2 isoform X4 [Plutella xylostella]